MDSETLDALSPPWEPVVQGLWSRLTGGAYPLRARQISSGDREFETWSDGSTLFINATDAISASVAIHTYLRKACGRAIHWDTVLPLPLRELPACAPTSDAARVEEFYYLNFCSASYSTAYWTWTEWEREIDWMALHGVTMPLQLVGHEAVLAAVFTRRGLTDQEVQQFLGGPGYLPFVYMGCIDSFGGALSALWIDEHARLARRILGREREFGMTPVLPAFTGHVPAAIAPRDVIARSWEGMETHVLRPSSDLFAQITSEIITTQIEFFETDHLYASDPFIEMAPADVSDAAEYPSDVARALLKGMTAADPAARWVLQSWPFSYQGSYWRPDQVEAFLGSVPSEQVIVLDLWAEIQPQWQKFEGFFGHPWVWSGLVNFGGRGDLVGNLRSMESGIEDALSSVHRPIGMGLTMEAIHISPVFYEFISDRAWTQSAEPLLQWIREFGRERYALDDPRVDAVWEHLHNSVLSARAEDIFPERYRTTITLQPTFSLLDEHASIDEDIASTLFYEPQELMRAWTGLHELSVEYPELSAGPLGSDLVQVGIMVLLRLADHRFRNILRVARDGKMPTSDSFDEFLGLFDTIDELASTRDELTMRAWEASAANWATSRHEEAILRDNARRVVTVWNTVENPGNVDYSARIWGGLISDYYKPRWRHWFESLSGALRPETRAAAQMQLDESLANLSHAFLASGASMSTRNVRDATELCGIQLAQFAWEFGDLRMSSAASESHSRP